MSLLSEKNCELWLKYARQMKRELVWNPDFFTEEVAFYLDGVSFVHKRNPMSSSVGTKIRVWKKKSEDFKYIAKGSKDLPGGGRLHLMVAIACGKGIILH